jgi:recombination protein RecA
MTKTLPLNLLHGWRFENVPETVPSSIAAVDAVCSGWPRGRISEILGPLSSGRTTILHRLLANMTAATEVCAVVDVMDSFDPATAELNGVDLARLCWIRCGGNVEHAMRAADLLLHAGGLGAVAMDFGGVSPLQIQRIPPSYWFRFRRAVESSRTVFVTLAERPLAKSSSSLVVETESREATFTPRLFREMHCRVSVRKPYSTAATELHGLVPQA